MASVQEERLPPVEQQIQADGHDDGVARRGGKARAEHPQPQDAYMDGSEDDVEHYGAHREHHRGHRVPLGLADGLECGKNEGKRQFKGAHPQVGHAARQHIPGRSHQGHDPRRSQIQQQVEDGPQHHRHQEQHPGVVPGPLPLSGTQKLADHRHPRHAEARLEGGEDIQQGPGQRNARLGGHGVGDLADEIGVYQLVEGLYEVGPEHRQSQNQKGLVQIGLPEQQLRPVTPLFHRIHSFLLRMYPSIIMRNTSRRKP